MTEQEILGAGFVKVDDFMYPYQKPLYEDPDQDDLPYLFAMTLDPLTLGMYLPGGTLIYFTAEATVEQVIEIGNIISVIDPG